MTDREKIIKWLEETEIMLIQAVDSGGEMSVMGAFKCLNRVTDAIAMLKELPEIVRCKNCKWFSEKGFCKHPDGGAGNIRPADWFCGDGKRREVE